MQGKGRKSKQNKFCNYNFFCPGITFNFKNIAKFFAKNGETCFGASPFCEIFQPKIWNNDILIMIYLQLYNDNLMS